MRLSLFFLTFLLFLPAVALGAEVMPVPHQSMFPEPSLDPPWEMPYEDPFESLKKRAAGGNANAQYELAHYYLVGPAETRDARKAVEWCRKAAERGSETAKMSLSSFQEFLAALEKAEKGDAYSQYAVGHSLLSATGDMTDAEGIMWLEKAAKQGYAEASEILEQAGYYRGLRELKEGKISEGISRMEKSAAAGLPFAQVFMGVAYADGAYVKRDTAKMLEYFRKAAEQDFPPESQDPRASAVEMAKMLMACCYLFGVGVSRDTEEAVAWMTKTCACPSRMMAYYSLGYICAEAGRDAEAAEVWEKALSLKETEAEKREALRKLTGYFPTRLGYEGNVAVYEEFVARSRTEALQSLGELYLKGKGVKKDAAKGVKYLLAAEASGDKHLRGPHMSKLLAECYALGEGVPRDEAEAMRRLMKIPSGVSGMPGVYEVSPWQSVSPRESSASEAEAWVQMGDIFFDAEKWEDAVRWYAKAYAKDPQFFGGWTKWAYCYAAGKGTAKDVKKAETLLGADETGQRAEALADLCYVAGDAAKTVIWLTAAAKKGSAGAWHKLGWCLENGFGVEKNPVRALVYYAQAEKLGSREAKRSIIRCCLYGIGMEKSPEKALAAASVETPKGKHDIPGPWVGDTPRGEADFCYEVAEICLRGNVEKYPVVSDASLSVKKSIDTKTARVFLERAAAGGVQEARKSLALLENVPVPEEYEQLLYVPFNIRWMLSPETTR